MAAYIFAVAGELTKVLEKFAKLNPHQLAGHVANNDFWTAEVVHVLAGIDGYQARFERMASAETAYIERHKTIQFPLDEPYGYMFEAPTRPSSVPKQERTETRKALCEAWYAYLVRIFRAGLATRDEAKALADRVGISIDPQDFRDR